MPCAFRSLAAQVSLERGCIFTISGVPAPLKELTFSQFFRIWQILCQSLPIRRISGRKSGGLPAELRWSSGRNSIQHSISFQSTAGRRTTRQRVPEARWRIIRGRESSDSQKQTCGQGFRTYTRKANVWFHRFGSIFKKIYITRRCACIWRVRFFFVLNLDLPRYKELKVGVWPGWLAEG